MEPKRFLEVTVKFRCATGDLARALQFLTHELHALAASGGSGVAGRWILTEPQVTSGKLTEELE